VFSFRKSLYAAAIAGAVAAFSFSTAQGQATATICVDGTTSAAAGRGACSGHGGVDRAATAKEKQGVRKQARAAKTAANATAGAQLTVTCSDGTVSNSPRRGACSGHGGIAAAATTGKRTGRPIPMPGTAVTPSRRPSARSGTPGSGAPEDNDPADAVARCKDGLYSHAKHRQGACSRHGGVASWM
jgi:hypothetical protein